MSDSNRSSETICIDTMRVFDSCSSQDCLEDLELTFEEGDQTTINDAAYIKSKCTEVTGVTFAIDPVPFNKGFYTVSATYSFRAQIEAYTSDASDPPTVVFGTANFTKMVILFGSDSNTQRFASNETAVTTAPSQTSGCASCCDGTLPIATVNVASPMCLAASLNAPVEPSTDSTVTLTLGLFAIIQLERPVSLLIPSYNYCVPEGECATSTDTPCELFSRINFPTSEFFPQGIEAFTSSNSGCGCESSVNSEADDNGSNS